MDDATLQGWIGRTEACEDVAARGPLERLAALLDHETPPWRAGEVPALGHWLYFLPKARQSQIGEDGHPLRGGLIPPIDLPRRMWAGGRLTFPRPLPAGAAVERRSTVVDVKRKTGRSGDMVFVTLRHAVMVDDEAAVIEEQDLVYRGADGAAPAPAQPPAAPEAPPAVSLHARQLVADPVQLFRYSALTFNSHRIHYDRDYATRVEGYPGLVVHGPYLATLLVDHFLRWRPQAAIASFAFRARRPVFDGRPFSLHLGEDGDGFVLWVADDQGQLAMTATLAAS
jgi:3-methylfumaryl-CoA hydratase